MADKAGLSDERLRLARQGHHALRRRHRPATPSPTAPVTPPRCPRWPAASTPSWCRRASTKKEAPLAGLFDPTFTDAYLAAHRRQSTVTSHHELVSTAMDGTVPDVAGTPVAATPAATGAGPAARGAGAPTGTRGRRPSQLLGIRGPLALRWRIGLGGARRGVDLRHLDLAAYALNTGSALVPTPAATWKALADLWSTGTLQSDLVGVGAARGHRLQHLGGDRHRRSASPSAPSPRSRRSSSRRSGSCATSRPPPSRRCSCCGWASTRARRSG